MERQIPPLSIRDAGEEYECGTVAELRPARKAIAIGFRWGDDLIAAAIRLCGASTGLGETGCPVVVSIQRAGLGRSTIE